MLTRLVIINSKTYAKADIEIHGNNSLQIVGPNNIGKSTLIYALNFLYIIDTKRMDFSGNRKGNANTIAHYFPDVDASFMVFEILKNNYYCILISKNDNGELVYHKIEHEYKTSHYFDKTEQGDRVKKLKAILSNFTTTNIQYIKFNNKQEVFKSIYQKGKKNNGVVWINANAQTDGNSNNFSKIYKYLVNPKLVNNQSLKDVLMIADNKEKIDIEFTKRDEKTISDFNKKNKEIHVIEKIQVEFEKFKKTVSDYKSCRNLLSELVFLFNKKYPEEREALEAKILKNDKILEGKKIEYKNKSYQLGELKIQVGRLDEKIKTREIEINKQINRIKVIEQYETIEFLEVEKNMSDKTRKSIEANLTNIEDKKLTAINVESKIAEIKNKITRTQNKINDNSDLLIHNISENQQDKELLNQILSQEISSLLKENIVKKISKVDNNLSLFDGVIQLPNLTGKNILSIEELKVEIAKINQDLETEIILLETIQDLEQKQSQVMELKNSISIIEEKIKEINSLEHTKQVLESTRIDLEKLKKEKTNIETKEIKAIEKRINELTGKEIPNLKELISNLNDEKTNNLQWKIEIENSGSVPVECRENNNLIKNIFPKFKECRDNIYRLKNCKDLQFSNIKNKINSLAMIADENEFITKLDEEITTLSNKKSAISHLLQAMASNFANPCVNILNKYSEFEKSVVNKINNKLGKVKISDISDLKIKLKEDEKLVGDIESIGKITNFHDLVSDVDEELESNIEILRQYLHQEKRIEFSDIFDIEIHLNSKGKKIKISLSNQIESDGTDKMIRLIIIASIINHFVINDKENKITIFIDEIGQVDKDNRLEIIKFCEDNNFIPILANPDTPYDGFDKYYMIRRNDQGKITLSEKNGNVFYRKQLQNGKN